MDVRQAVGKSFVGRTVLSVRTSDKIVIDGRDVAAQLKLTDEQPARPVGDDWNIVANCTDVVNGTLVAAVVTGAEWERLVNRDGVAAVMENPPMQLLDCP